MQKTPGNAPRPLDLTDAPADAVAHFWNRVSPTDQATECRLWTGCTDRFGYGLARFMGAVRRANRIAYALAHGPIPAGQLVLHGCDNPRCCNPAHLSLGSHQENANDRKERGRGWSPGPDLDCALTADDVRIMRDDVAADVDTRRGIAECYGLTYQTVMDIMNGKTWCDAGGATPEEIDAAETRRRDEFAKQVRAEFAAGTRIQPLAKKFKIGWRKARDIVQERGIWAVKPEAPRAPSIQP